VLLLLDQILEHWFESFEEHFYIVGERKNLPIYP